MIELINRFELHLDRFAVKTENQQFTYKELLVQAEGLSQYISNGQSIKGERVCFMVPSGFDYVKTLLGIWMAGGIAVPLCLTHPIPQLEYVIDDTEPLLLLGSAVYLEKLNSLASPRGIKVVNLEEVRSSSSSATSESSDEPGLILYTSGTTNKPKGVLIKYSNIEAQILALTKAWQWRSDDHILCTLPLHHIHGIVNIICCSLWSGACCEFSEFDEEKVFRIFERGEVNLYMAVPTIYYKLITFFDTQTPEFQQRLSEVMKKFRLMVSGSAALPVSVLEKWQQISGHTLLERYGMTEIGMALSNPYQGERRAGCVGLPLPGVEIRLVDESNNVVEKEPGEIQVRGKTVFEAYWQNSRATEEAFTNEGWFRTGDLGVIENGYYKIMGRLSVDIIKTGGYKVSALEIEEVLRTHPAIKDCAVVGIEDIEWGERIAAALIVKDEIETEGLINWLKEKLPGYKVPRIFKLVTDLPRNAMGKVTKKEVKNLFS